MYSSMQTMGSLAPNVPYSYEQTPVPQGMTSKELTYISDRMHSEELLTKLCVQAAIQCKNHLFSQMFHQFAHASFHHFTEMLGILQQESQRQQG